ncbi:hypothetical protein H6P81_009933 [Aristolochia fimbriata]|uniref:Uncharacterized protein n=1 Tax=Aristolochia fimbriata TaxID=158543 RepID=A0AAV7EMG1_ARIFI|nr:hypothetical protein H6P81_009933 [Aristolochia fimbriata]
MTNIPPIGGGGFSLSYSSRSRLACLPNGGSYPSFGVKRAGLSATFCRISQSFVVGPTSAPSAPVDLPERTARPTAGSLPVGTGDSWQPGSDRVDSQPPRADRSFVRGADKTRGGGGGGEVAVARFDIPPLAHPFASSLISLFNAFQLSFCPWVQALFASLSFSRFSYIASLLLPPSFNLVAPFEDIHRRGGNNLPKP